MYFGRGFGPVGILLALVGVLLSYLACLYGVELDQKSLVAFGVWSLAAILIAFVVDLLFKYVLVLAILYVAAMWWTDNPAFRAAAIGAKGLRAAVCTKIPDDTPELPIKEWIC